MCQVSLGYVILSTACDTLPAALLSSVSPGGQSRLSTLSPPTLASHSGQLESCVVFSGLWKKGLRKEITEIVEGVIFFTKKPLSV